jgi:predicted PurR-regulated permease PerM
MVSPTNGQIRRQVVSLATDTTEVDARWVRRRNIAFTILCWIAIAGVIIWMASQVYHAIIVLVMACVLAYALFPAVEMLRRWMPRWLAILLVYLALFAVVGGFGYLLVSTAVTEVKAHIAEIKNAFGPGGTLGLVVQQLEAAGISSAQIDAFSSTLSGALGSTAKDLPDVLSRFFNGVLDTVLVVVVSVYLVIDGERLANWANTRTPRRYRGYVQGFLSGLQRVVGGYIRGQLSMALLVGVLVGLGMFFLRVPFAPLLGLLAFVLEFIPIIGTLISGAICFLIALTQGWPLALVVLAYFVVVHVIEGDVLGPRIVGQAVGLHPVVSIIALAAGAERFHVWGALFSAPLAGLLQVVIVDMWQEWRKAHADEFSEDLAAQPEDHVPVAALVDSAAGAVILNESGPTLDGDAGEDELPEIEPGIEPGFSGGMG